MARYSITAVGDTTTKTTVTARDHTFVMDQPVAGGGTDQGPTPVEIELGAFLGCLTVVINMIAAEHGVTVANLKMGASGELDPSRLIGKETENRAGFQSIDIEVQFDSDGDEAAKKAILDESLTRCPVSDNLGAETPITAVVTG